MNRKRYLQGLRLQRIVALGLVGGACAVVQRFPSFLLLD
jgi:hypothetical protein